MQKAIFNAFLCLVMTVLLSTGFAKIAFAEDCKPEEHCDDGTKGKGGEADEKGPESGEDSSGPEESDPPPKGNDEAR